jgi:hypothetical protein
VLNTKPGVTPGFFLMGLCESGDRAFATKAVMRGPDPRIHRSSKMFFCEEGWIAGSSPAMT